MAETEEHNDGGATSSDDDDVADEGASDHDEHEVEEEEELAAEDLSLEAENVDSSSSTKKKKKISKVVFGDKFLAQTENFNEKLRKRGVIYVARVPPRMTPTKVKSLLSEFGEVTRVYLVQEDKTARQRRKKQGGSGSKRFTEGWVEFGKKSVAKHVALSLNGTPITNYKRSVHYGDLWNLKYLNKFKWSHLTEKVAYERRVREQKLRVEMMQARRENASYVELVETGKKLDKIEARKRKRGEGLSEAKSSGDDEARKKRSTRQKKPVNDKADGATKRALLRALVQD